MTVAPETLLLNPHCNFNFNFEGGNFMDLNLKYQNQYLILPADDGSREDTKLAVEYSDEEIQAFLEQGYILVDSDDFNKLIGNYDIQYCIDKDGSIYEAPDYIPSVQEVQEEMIARFKVNRDAEEVKPIDYQGNVYDYDEKARGRINAAIIALEAQGEKANIAWTLADNTSVIVTADDLRMVIANVAIRSNQLHVKYRTLKEQVLACKSLKELEQIVW